MSEYDRRPQGRDQLTMSGARADDETLGEDQDDGPQANQSIFASIENGHADPANDLDGYYPADPQGGRMPPPARQRFDSVSTQMTDCNAPETIERLFGPSARGNISGRTIQASPRPSPGPRALNLGNSVLNRRAARASSGDSFPGNTPSNRARALSRQRDLAGRLHTDHDRQAAAMTMPPPVASNNSAATPGSFQDLANRYESARFAASRHSLQQRHRKGKLNREDEMKWIRMEALRRNHQQRRGRSETPAGEDEDDDDVDPAAVEYSRMERVMQDMRDRNEATVEDEIKYMKFQQMETERLERRNRNLDDSRASSPSNSSQIFVNGSGTPPRGFEGIFGDRANIARGKFPRRKYVTTSEVARKRAKKAVRAGQISNRTDPRAAPRKGYGNDGRGRNLEFGDYFLKATANEDRPDVIEVYLDHVAHEVQEEMEKKATLPVYAGTALKDRLRQVRRSWNTKTKAFCKRYGLPAPPKVHIADEEEKRFNRAKCNIYARIRAGQLNMEQACRFGVEANIEMCRWRAKYHQTIGNNNAPSNLPDLSDLDGLKLPTTEEFDDAYKPKYDKIMEFVGQMFAECQDRIRLNHDRLHTLFAKVEIPDPYDEVTSDEDEDEDGEDAEEAAVRAAMEAEKADAGAEAGRHDAVVEDDDERMFPDITV